jgi:Holliday junction resolvasome RuvABC endonuclease subunit
MKQTEKQYIIRVVTTKEMHERIKDILKDVYTWIKEDLSNVLDVEYYVKGKIDDLED